MTAPTRISSAPGGIHTGTTTRSTGAVTYQTGDFIVIVATTENSTVTLTNPTGGANVSFGAPDISTQVANTCNLYCWSAFATGPGTAQVFNSTTGATTFVAEMVAFVYRNSAGLGNTANKTGGTSTVLSITRTGDNSAIVAILGDGASTTDVAVGFTPTGGTQDEAVNVAQVTVFCVDWADQGANGTANYGISPGTFTTAGPLAIATVEILGIVSGTDWTATVTDTLGLVDDASALSGPAVTQTDSEGLVDSQSQTASFSPTITNVQGLLDPVSQATTHVRTVSDIIGVTDFELTSVLVINAGASVISYARGQSDAINLLDSYAAFHNQDIFDVASIFDSTAQFTTRILTDTLGEVDSVSALPFLSVTLSDLLGLTDTGDSIAYEYDYVQTEDIAVTDPSSIVNIYNRTIQDSVGILDSVDFGFTASAVVDNIGIVDNVLVTLTHNVVDIIGITDSLNGNILNTLARIELLGLTDNIIISVISAQSFTDVIGGVDSTLVAQGTSPIVNDVLGLVDSTSSATNANTIITNTLGLLDTTGQVVTYSPVVTDLQGLSDSEVSSTNINIIVTDSVGIVDDAKLLLTKILVDSENMSDGLLRTSNTLVTVTDALNNQDDLSAGSTTANNVQVTISDILNTSDTNIQTTGINISTNDNLGLADIFLQVSNIQKLNTDNINSVDNTILVNSYAPIIIDILQAQDNQVMGFNVNMTLFDTLELQDQIASLTNAIQIVTDSIGIVDATSLLQNINRALTDSINGIDTISGASNIVYELSDGQILHDLVSQQANISQALQELIGLTDITSKFSATTLSDTLTLQDISTSSSAIIQQFVDALQLSDVLDPPTADYVRAIDDTLNILDILSKAGIVKVNLTVGDLHLKWVIGQGSIR